MLDHLNAGQAGEVVDQAVHPGPLLGHDRQEAAPRGRIVLSGTE